MFPASKASTKVRTKTMKGRVRWDEANLEEINAKKPARRKIDEPKTPYHPMQVEDGPSSPTWNPSNSNSYAAYAEALRIALNKVALNKYYPKQFGGCTLSDDEADVKDKEEGSIKETRATKFEEHRRAHYDEFKKVKELQQKGSSLDYEDDYSNHEERFNSSPFLSIVTREIHIDSDDEIMKTIDIEGNS